MKHLPKEYQYYVLFKQRTPYGYFALDIQRNMVGLHYHSLTWGTQIFKQMKKDFLGLIETLRSKGTKKIVASYNGDGKEKWEKFIAMLGFKKPEQVYISIMEI